MRVPGHAMANSIIRFIDRRKRPLDRERLKRVQSFTASLLPADRPRWLRGAVERFDQCINGCWRCGLPICTICVERATLRAKAKDLAFFSRFEKDHIRALTV